MEDPTYASLSPMQKGMLADHLRHAEPGLDLLQIFCEAHERLDPKIFEQAWNVVVNRHDLLRSRFLWEEVDEPVREVLPSIRMPFVELDWRDSSGREQSARFEAFFREDRRSGMSLTEAPLLRMTLVRMGRKLWRWCLTIHHLLLDARGMLLLLDELYPVYESLLAGTEPVLPPASHFGDYVAWHRQQDWSSAEAWWRQQLSGFIKPTPAPFQNMQGCGEGDCWGDHLVELPARVTRGLAGLAARADVTLNTVLQGAWALVLGRCNGEGDVVFGAVRACRKSNVTSAPTSVGLFVNTLPVRVDISPENELIPWLGSLRRQWRAMGAFENVPLSHVQRWSEVPRGERLLECIFNYQEPSWDKVLGSRGGAWRRRRFGLRCQTSYPLTLDVYGGGGSLELNLVYDRRALSADSISQLMKCLEEVLASMASSRGGRLGDIEMVSKATRHQVVTAWNKTARRYPKKCVHELFELQAKRMPDAVAATVNAESITYYKLNLRANRLGRHLRRLGVGPGTMVAVCLERSLDLLAALLGVMKAGGAYVPLDPEYPTERLAFMLEDTGAPLVLTVSRLASRLPATVAKVVLLDTDWPEIKLQSSDGFQSLVDAESVAYVIYTSGSTGRPKGVVVPHRGIARLVINADYASISADDVFLQAAPVSFDASTFEIWGALLNGARVEILPAGRFAIEDLARFIQAQRVTTMFVTTALFQQLTELHSDALGGVRQLLTGGETMPVETMRRALQSLPGTRIIHCYGPTENTTFTTCLAIESVDKDAGSIPIGRPIANTSVYVLDSQLRPVPPGVPGELYAGGDGLAHGYLNRPELTEERFITHPLGSGSVGRLYRTGDVVRWLPDGTIDFIGRVDHQVKIRGHRIELGEIESALCSHGDVRDAVVLVREECPGNKRLTAFLSLFRKLSIREIRRYLESRLPAYMIPSVFVPLESLPLNSNGKVDRRALLALLMTKESETGDDAQEAVTRVAPRTETEDIVASIWSEVLEIPLVGMQDHFFELGGHSLLAMTTVSKVRKALHKSFQVRVLFENPVLEDFCIALQKVGLGSADELTTPITKVALKGPPQASSFQERIWSGYLHRKPDDAANLLVCFRLKGALDVKALEQSLTEVVRRHDILRTRLEGQQGRMVQNIAPAEPVTVEVLALSRAPRRSPELSKLISGITHATLDDGTGPMLRFTLLQWSESRHLLLVIFHPLTYDSSVRRILLRELEVLYAAHKEDRQALLPEPTLQYADFAVWQQKWLGKDTVARRRLLNHWTQVLDSEKLPAVELPFPRTSPGEATAEESVLWMLFKRTTTSQARHFAKEHGATLFMLLLACAKVLLYRRTRQTDMLVGTYFASQSHSEMECVMGPRSNLVVLRTNLSDNPTFSNILLRVREVVLDAQAHQDMPFEHLCAALHACGKPVPPIEALFMHTHVEWPILRLEGIRTHQSTILGGSIPWGFSINFLSREDRSDFLRACCVFDARRYEPEEVRKFVSALVSMVETVIARPSVTLDELAIRA
ncbi:amino acid adenylation domain-containing protein [Roseimicrobium gellanilyticum]|uniref:Amino acid adenylation domain-containing protein n=1 Tax=Roseimicrobium gellanilyticum TaxID=748857 RepID=A0A366HLU5_9BACT|nr:non-ribosomal peptide synthetase [Roseimicrobium gellanilyticum]RBP43898.1 amino acid adenylation domain-containing protein [Roseimicrobium gellanilyticum]